MPRRKKSHVGLGKPPHTRVRPPGDKLDLSGGGPLGPPGAGQGASHSGADPRALQMNTGANPTGQRGPPVGNVKAANAREAHGHSSVQRTARKPTIGSMLSAARSVPADAKLKGR